MRKSKISKVAVTERDERLFRYLFVNKVATVKDIVSDIFDKTSFKTVHKRLVKLSRNQLLVAEAQRERGNRMVYSLSSKGFERYIADKTAVKRAQLKSDCIEHDLTMLTIKRKLRKFKMVEAVYSENLCQSGMMDDIAQIKALREIRPDAIVKLKVQDKDLFLPLEYEASSKYSKRNEKLLAKYYTAPQVLAVLFISKNATIEKRIVRKDAAKKHKSKGKFYYCQLENVLNANEQLSFTNASKEIFVIS